MKPKVVYLLGAGHCGSTLLSLLLNGHPAMVAVSELSKLDESLAAGDPVLGEAGWQAIAARYRATTGRTLAELDLRHPSWREVARWSVADAASWAGPRAALYAAIAEVTGRPWIADASKAWQPMALMDRSGLFDLRVIHLVRDGRGVVHSYAKKYGQARHGLAKWMKHGVAAAALAPRFGQRWLRVRYEQLAANPAAELARITDWLGLPYDPAMLSFRRHPWLGIGGNRMSKRADDTIRLDERWRREMPRHHRLLVDVVGGALNRYYGY